MLREGSVWRRWDLHVHSPETALSNQFEGATPHEKWANYFDALEAAGDFGCIGITDYFSIEGYRHVAAHKAAGKLSNIGLIIPNIELRIIPVTDRNRAINIHLLVCPSVVEDLDDALFSNLSFTFHDQVYKATRHGLTELGRRVGGSKLDERAAYVLGVGQFKVDAGQLRKCLQDHPKLKRNALVVIAQSSQDGNSGIQDTGMKAVREELYRFADCIFSGNPQDREYFLGAGVDSAEKIREKFRGLKPCIHGSDAHTCSAIGQAALDRYTWIKADQTFEGLKQICHEPAERVWIGKYPPTGPLHRINRARIAFPDGATIGSRTDESAFCFRGSTELDFAAGLTCVIGGRGTGKSTLLNLLHEALAPRTNTYFRGQSVRLAGEPLSIPLHVEVDYVGKQQDVEFISQNEVEAFALEPHRLTRAIATRLRALDGGDINVELAQLAEGAAGWRRLAELHRSRHAARVKLQELHANLDSLTVLVTSFGDPRYTTVSDQLRERAARAQALQTSRGRLGHAVADVERAVKAVSTPIVGEDACAVRLREFVSAVEGALAAAVEDLDVATSTAEEQSVAAEIERLTEQMGEFLKERGLSVENMNDVTQATQGIAALRAQIQDQEKMVAELDVAITEGSGAKNGRVGFEAAVNASLTQLNEMFRHGNRDLRKIEIKYRFDKEAAEGALLDELNRQLEGAFGRKSRVDHLAPELSKAGSPLDTALDDLVAAVRASDTKTAETLDAFFGQETNAAVFDCIRRSLLVDVDRFMRFEILYDGIAMERSSFGQRCSAVLVVLLSTGNTPIVIDEPEAHLDSSLIANYLVDLIKNVKRQRQIIFATHNANFVINGDAELIHVISMEHAGPSEVKSITIEDIDARPLLLALEGGERAFLKREGRYELQL